MFLLTLGENDNNYDYAVRGVIKIGVIPILFDSDTYYYGNYNVKISICESIVVT